jgi:mannose-1-phosphate guanylyltransferase/mannose-6-phosphate isomerase
MAVLLIFTRCNTDDAAKVCVWSDSKGFLMIHPVVMAGGKGERFWPYSNAKHPKQLLPLVTKQSMLEDTLRNIRALGKTGPTRLVVSANLEKPVKSKTRGMKNVLTIAEPRGRNTAAAVALAARMIMRQDPQGVMLVLTADHAIGPAKEFARAMKVAAETAAQGDCLVTFGIPPLRPETGYGYVEAKPGVRTVNGLKVVDVAGFHEKPSADKAAAFVESGRFYWNSGMFAWRVDYLWEQFRAHMPVTAAAFEKAGDLDPKKPTFAAKLKKIYATIPDISIDYGILEKASAIRMVIPAFKWDDIGAWSSLDRLHAADGAGNRAVGETIQLESTGTTCFSDSGIVATFGVKDLLVVHHDGVTMVVHKSQTARLKELVKKVGENKKWAGYL